jgi:hypothetical protein
MTRAIEYFEPNGVTAIPGNAYDFGTKAASTSAQRKLWLRNSGDEVLGATLTDRLVDALLNGGVGIIKFALDTVSVRPPYGGLAVVGGAGGVFGATGLRYFKVTRLNASGETQGSVEFSFDVTNIALRVELSWLLPAGPAGTGVKVYATTTPGVYPASSLISGTLGAGATTFSWTGAAPAAGTVPTENTTGGAGPVYGTPPALGTTDLTLGALAVGEARALWFGYIFGATVTDVDYLVALHPLEL